MMNADIRSQILQYRTPILIGASSLMVGSCLALFDLGFDTVFPSAADWYYENYKTKGAIVPLFANMAVGAIVVLPVWGVFRLLRVRN